MCGLPILPTVCCIILPWIYWTTPCRISASDTFPFQVDSHSQLKKMNPCYFNYAAALSVSEGTLVLLLFFLTYICFHLLDIQLFLSVPPDLFLLDSHFLTSSLT